MRPYPVEFRRICGVHLILENEPLHCSPTSATILDWPSGHRPSLGIHGRKPAALVFAIGRRSQNAAIPVLYVLWQDLCDPLPDVLPKFPRCLLKLEIHTLSLKIVHLGCTTSPLNNKWFDMPPSPSSQHKHISSL
jgi:hypothetical protein